MKFRYHKLLLKERSPFFGSTILKPIIPETIVGFSYDIAKHGFGILGQKGFFDKFVVNFDLVKEEIELKLRK